MPREQVTQLSRVNTSCMAKLADMVKLEDMKVTYMAHTFGG